MADRSHPLHIADTLFDDIEAYGLLYAHIDQRLDELEARRRAYLARPEARLKCTMLEETRTCLLAWADASHGCLRETICENIDAAISSASGHAALPLRLARREIRNWERLAARLA